MSPSNQPDPGAVAFLRGGGSEVDQIRELLFGAQMRDYEARFARLEETLMRETAELRESTRHRFDQLENHVRTELEALRSRSQAENGGREHVRQPGTVSAAAGPDSRDDPAPEIRARCEELAAIMEDRVHELQSGTINRAALAALFSEVALRLSDAFRAPDSKS